ncbi:conjugal transfer protein TrbL [Deinococcus multiflagellatus]|uniref:Conjugal transfer protein TrbL n=2 Tax=Deinococcus multiflagellatus TaxID=1656887 RepID=A0ABW1ZQ01_9DEIO
MLLVLVLGQASATSSGSMNVDLLVPRAEQWIAGTFALIKEFKVFPAMGLVGCTLVLCFFVLGFLKNWPARNMAAIFRSLVLSVLAVTLINDATRNVGALGTMFTLPMITWQKAYTASTTAVKPKLENGVINDTRNLAITMNSFVSNAMMSVNAMGAFDGSQVTGSDPKAAAAAAADQAILSVKNRTAEETKTLQSLSSVYQIGYLIIMVMFMGFAGVIYGSAMFVVLGMAMLPVGLGFWAGGNSSGLQSILKTWLAAILTVTLAPPIMLMVSTSAMKQPTAYIKGQIDPLNAQAKATMQQYATAYSTCAATHKDDWIMANTATEVCNVGSNFGLFASNFGSAAWKIIQGFGFMIVIMIVCLSVGAYLIRALPGMLTSLMAGGASSGGPEMSMARAASGMQQAARTMQAALTGGGAALAGAARGAVDTGVVGARGAVAAGSVGGRAAAATGGALRSAGEAGINAMRDNAAVNATTARRNEQTRVANVAREAAGLSPEQGTNPREVRAQLAAAGGLPSQAAAASKARAASEGAALTAADAGAARSHAAAYNAQEQNKGVTTPGYAPKTMTDQQAHSQLKAAGGLPSQRGAADARYSAGNPMKPTAGEQARADASKQGYGQPYRDAKMQGGDAGSLRKENDARAAAQKARLAGGGEINGRGDASSRSPSSGATPSSAGRDAEKK